MLNDIGDIYFAEIRNKVIYGGKSAHIANFLIGLMEISFDIEGIDLI